MNLTAGHIFSPDHIISDWNTLPHWDVGRHSQDCDCRMQNPDGITFGGFLLDLKSIQKRGFDCGLDCIMLSIFANQSRFAILSWHNKYA